MVYPEKQRPQEAQNSGRHSFPGSVSERYRSDFWQENIERWVKQEHMNGKFSARSSNRVTGSERMSSSFLRNGRRQNVSQIPDSKVSRATNNEYVYHPGFQGSPESQANNLKYKFGKKKPGDDPQQPIKFRPKGFGMLYDELEFERRYKKVFDVNRQMHFVHSNFVSGQKIFKRNKLPPIGHIPSLPSEPSDTSDIFAIMSVQRFNLSEENKLPRAPVSSPGEKERPSQSLSFVTTQLKSTRKCVEIPQENNVSSGFIPGTAKSAGYSPFTGVKGVSSHGSSKENSNRLSLASREDDSAFGTLTEEASPQVQADDRQYTPSARSEKNSSKKTKAGEEAKSWRSFKKSRKESIDPPETPDQDSEPFNISVSVNIRPKDPVRFINGENVDEKDVGEQVYHQCVIQSPREVIDIEDAQFSRTSTVDKVLHPTILEANEAELDKNADNVFRGKNVVTLTNPYGLLSQRVTYPEQIKLDHALTPRQDGTQANAISSDKRVKNNDDALNVDTTKTSLDTYVVKAVPRNPSVN